ncbi:MAG: hypothetical protein H6609_16315 [Ignavibacteriales bacterium]|nr:hypothetical protein [Ignavibacteriales bacterium]
MGVLTRIVKTVYDEVTKPKSFVKGENFENYVRQFIFPTELYQLEHHSHDYNSNKGDYVQTSLNPDFLFSSKKNKKKFYVEAKYRSDFQEKGIEWCKTYQLKRYQETNKELPVFIALGVQGKPSRPKYLFIFPLKKVKYTKLFDSVLEKYEVETDTPIEQTKLWKMLY